MKKRKDVIKYVVESVYKYVYVLLLVFFFSCSIPKRVPMQSGKYIVESRLGIYTRLMGLDGIWFIPSNTLKAGDTVQIAVTTHKIRKHGKR